MNQKIEFLLNKASESEIAEHLRACDGDFVPLLSGRVDINKYAQKIEKKAMRFEAWSGGTLIGLVAAYNNDMEMRIAYITSISVLKEWTRKGIATRLLRCCLEHAKSSGMQHVSLEVLGNNKLAIKLYENSGFIVIKVNTPFVTMNLELANG